MARISFVCVLLLVLLGCKSTGEEDSKQEVPTNPKIGRIYIHGNGALQFFEKKPCEISYTSADGKTSFHELPARAKFRGGSTSRYGKHSYSLELSEPHSLEGMPANDDWMLIASYNDKTFMRHKMGYDLFRSLGHEAPLVHYVEVYHDTTYYGLFLLVEKMGRSKLEMKHSNAGRIFKEPPLFGAPNAFTDVQLQDSNCYAQKYPKFQAQNANEELHALHLFLHQASDEEFATSVSHYFDLNNIIDWHLLLIWLNSGDGVLKNFFLYQQEIQTPFRVGLWDVDHSLGRDGDNEPNPEGKCKPERNILLKRLLETNAEDYREKLKTRYEQLRQNLFTQKHLEDALTANYTTIEPYLAPNFEKWPIDATDYFDAFTTEQELEYIQNWFGKHIKYVDAYMNSL